MVSAVITAAGKNSRMREDLVSKGMKIEHKLLMDLKGKPVIIRTIENVLESGVKKCVVVLGHYSEEIDDVLKDFSNDKVKIVYNHDLKSE